MKKHTASGSNSSRLDYVVRQARRGDEAKVRAFGRALWFGETGQSNLDPYVSSVFAKYWDENYLRAVFAMPQAVFVVAQHQNEVIGIATSNLKVGEPQTAQLSRLAVLAAYRGQDIERALLHHCELALPRSATMLRTGVMQNEESELNFFIAQGFRGARLVEIGEGSQANIFVEMEKPIARRKPTNLSPLRHLEPSLN